MVNIKQTFKLKHNTTGHYMSEVDFGYIFKNEHPGSKCIGGESGARVHTSMYTS